jgi:hypothetical protein
LGGLYWLVVLLTLDFNQLGASSQSNAQASLSVTNYRTTDSTNIYYEKTNEMTNFISSDSQTSLNQQFQSANEIDPWAIGFQTASSSHQQLEIPSWKKYIESPQIQEFPEVDEFDEESVSVSLCFTIGSSCKYFNSNFWTCRLRDYNNKIFKVSY